MALQKDKHLLTKSFMEGTCLSMCPTAERNMREKNGLLHVFEIEESTRLERRPRADPGLVVKEYSRPAAGRHDPKPNELRPAPVLANTLKHLIFNICNRTDRPWSTVYQFVFDRMRAIRQDMIIQQIDGKEGALLLETIVRFLIYAGYKMCTESLANFDPYINNTHIQECLKRLLVFYDDDTSCRDNMAEFVGLYLIHNLVNSGSLEALNYGITKRKELGSNKTFQCSLAIQFAVLHKNYIRAFKLSKDLPTLHLCAFHQHILSLQRRAICQMSSGFNSKNSSYPLDLLAKLLSFNNEVKCKEFCEKHGLSTTNRKVAFLRTQYHENSKMEPIQFDIVSDELESVTTTVLLGRSLLHT